MSHPDACSICVPWPLSRTQYGVEVSATAAVNTSFARWIWADNTTFADIAPGWQYTGYASMAPGSELPRAARALGALSVLAWSAVQRAPGRIS